MYSSFHSFGLIVIKILMFVIKRISKSSVNKQQVFEVVKMSLPVKKKKNKEIV